MEDKNIRKELQEALERIEQLETQVKGYEQRDKEKEIRIQELEEKIQTYSHGAKLDLLAHMAKGKVGVEENVALNPQPLVARTPTYHTTFSLGFELLEITS